MSENMDVREISSFRDPSGFVYKKEGKFYRKIHKSYQANYDTFIKSGLYQHLVDEQQIISHTELQEDLEDPWIATLLPEQVPFITYSYEWSFSQLKDAALNTLHIQLAALKHGMTLKDASAFNMQLVNGKMRLIDTLSFEVYKEGEPWIAYKQFCQHFLAPLAIMAKTNLQLGSISRLFLDGIPLDVAVSLLPASARLSVGLSAHVYFHANSQKRHSKDVIVKANYQLPKMRLIGIIESLRSTVESLRLPKQKTVWGDYYNNTNYTEKGIEHKKEVIENWISKIHPESLWDAGANDGYFSRLGSRKGIFTVASDFDVMAIENAYVTMKKEEDTKLVPVVLDLMNPTPAAGWANQERASFLNRASFDLTLCLAFIHHLCITNNVPFSYLAKLMSEHSRYLIIEFVPKSDSNSQILLSRREDIFEEYDEMHFEQVFGTFFRILEKTQVQESTRTLYLMEKK